MSNYLAVATITATLQRTLQAVVQTDIEGARVTTVRPSDIGNGTPESGVNLFLYQVMTNPALHNLDAAPLRSRGLTPKRQAALDLYYMFSFYGNDTELEPQRLMGSVIRALNDKRVITQDMIQVACRDSTLPFLQASNLADQIQQISIVPLDLNLEDLSKAWSVFFQTPYMLSMGYKVLVVLVEGEAAPARGLPIRDRRTQGISPYYHQPQIEQISSQDNPEQPIVANSTLLIRGKQLKGDWATQVRLCGVIVTPTEVSDRQLVVPLSLLPDTALRAGVQSLQVIHPSSSNNHPSQHRGKESNAAPFVVRPQVLSITTTLDQGDEDEGLSGHLQIHTNLTVGGTQRVVLVLNQWNTEQPTSYLFNAPPRHRDGHTLSIPFQAVQPGDYLVRLMVDGAESQLDVDADATSPTYEWYCGPKVTLQPGVAHG
jgi:Pvc16 N-terminal domain